eukprot:GHVU01150059.1.p1 GENE.GHVU01150059.1~~GHVU01150059.1.p1  ORF type:complete len:173 (-),score=9.17 GHVU01150059.1:201-719(-)
MTSRRRREGGRTAHSRAQTYTHACAVVRASPLLATFAATETHQPLDAQSLVITKAAIVTQRPVATHDNPAAYQPIDRRPEEQLSSKRREGDRQRIVNTVLMFVKMLQVEAIIVMLKMVTTVVTAAMNDGHSSPVSISIGRGDAPVDALYLSPPRPTDQATPLSSFLCLLHNV